MNKIIILLFVFFLSCVQSYSQQLFATAGSMQGNVSWSIGEIITDGGAVADWNIYQGFNGAEVNVSTGLSDAVPFGLSIFPNPVVDKLTLHMDTDSKFSFRLIDIVGRTLIDDKNCSGQLEIDMSKYASGQYILQVYSTQFSKSTIILKK